MNNNRNKNNKPRRGRRQPRSGVTSTVIKPPMFRSNVIYSHKFRFQANAQATTTITAANLIQAAGVVGITATSVGAWNRAIRLKKIEIWSNTPTATSSETITLQWQPAVYQPSIEVSDTSSSLMAPAHIVARPPARSVLSDWQTGTSGITFCTVTANADAIMDISVQLIMIDDNTNGTVGVTTATAGEVFYLGLPIAAPVWIPVALRTTS